MVAKHSLFVLTTLLILNFPDASLFYQTKKYRQIALLLYVLNDVLTFAYFYLRNDIMMKTPLADVQKLQKAWMEWSEVNWIRSMISFVGLAFSFLSLHKIYELK